MEAYDQDESAAVSLIESGAELAGAAVGGAAGFVVGGPGGAAVGGAGGLALTRALKRIGSEVQQRWLAPREHLRIGAATAFAFASINSRILGGDAVRDDERWREDAGRGRSAAEEVLEGVIRSAAASWEERRVRYIGLFYASLAFRPDISPAYANTLLRLADQLGYRQLLLLSFFGRHAREDRLIYIDTARDERGRGNMPDGLAYDLDRLGDLGLVGVADEFGDVRVASVTAGGPSLALQQRLGSMSLTASGRDVHDLMRLETMPTDEVEALWDVFEASAGRAE